MDKWPMWIKASIATFLQNRLSPTDVYLEGVDDNKITTYPRFEIRVDGPAIDQTLKNVYFAHIYLNVLIVTKRDNKTYQHENFVGIAMSALSQNIPVFEYGPGESKNYFGCLQPSDKILTINYGESDEIATVVQTAVERVFTMLICEG